MRLRTSLVVEVQPKRNGGTGDGVDGGSPRQTKRALEDALIPIRSDEQRLFVSHSGSISGKITLAQFRSGCRKGS